MENLSFPEIDDAARDYVDARDNRMRMLKEEMGCSEKLLRLMREHKIAEYAFDNFTVRVLSTTKVKVKRAGEEENGDE